MKKTRFLHLLRCVTRQARVCESRRATKTIVSIGVFVVCNI